MYICIYGCTYHSMYVEIRGCCWSQFFLSIIGPQESNVGHQANKQVLLPTELNHPLHA